MSAGAEPVSHDQGTVDYFDQHLIDYGVARLEFAAHAIDSRKTEGASVVDLGCGTGNTLAHVREVTGLTDLVGIDVGERLLEKTRERVGCETVLGSILDTQLAETHRERFDFAIVAAVLHHLIGRSRKESKAFAGQAVENGLTMLKPGGHLVVVEPIFYPSLAMDALFYLKKSVTRLTSDRVKILGKWDNNIGAPVVSYMTNEELFELVRAGGRAEIVDKEVAPERLSRGVDAVLRKTNTTVVAKKL
jgi:SAM-dependent methyltransferase